MTARYTHLSAACSFGKCPLALTAFLIRAFRARAGIVCTGTAIANCANCPSIAQVIHARALTDSIALVV